MCIFYISLITLLFSTEKSEYKICSQVTIDCTRKAKEAIDTGSAGINCNCLPNCFELGYSTTSSDSRLSIETIRPEYISLSDAKYFKENMAVVHFYFKESKFTKNTKSIIYGFSEFLSNTGGLLGFFLGFSFLSAVEILYYIFLKPIIQCGSKQKQKIPFNN